MKYFSRGEGAPAASSYASANISGGVILRVGKHFRRRHLTRRQTSHFKGVSHGWGLFPRQGGLFLRKSLPWGWGSLPSPRRTLPSPNDTSQAMRSTH